MKVKMKVKRSNGKVRTYTVDRWRSGGIGQNYVTCTTCGKEWEFAIYTTTKDMRERVKEHSCGIKEMYDES